MNAARKIVPSFILFFAVVNSAAQPHLISEAEKYRMVNWNFEQGFPHKFTHCILKDINGFLWIGTETGLSRFDGGTFKNYLPVGKDSEKVPGVKIRGLIEDSLHNVWIGSD